MSELEDRLNAVLSNPAELSRLSEMARRLMGGAEAESSDAAPAPKQERDVLSALPAMLGQALGGLGCRILLSDCIYAMEGGSKVNPCEGSGSMFSQRILFLNYYGTDTGAGETPTLSASGCALQ